MFRTLFVLHLYEAWGPEQMAATMQNELWKAFDQMKLFKFPQKNQLMFVCVFLADARSSLVQL